MEGPIRLVAPAKAFMPPLELPPPNELPARFQSWESMLLLVFIGEFSVPIACPMPWFHAPFAPMMPAAAALPPYVEAPNTLLDAELPKPPSADAAPCPAPAMPPIP